MVHLAVNDKGDYKNKQTTPPKKNSNKGDDTQILESSQLPEFPL